MERHHTVGYFSMEIGLDPSMPTYSGGLGVLAGDTLRAAADLGVPLLGVTLLHRKGYLHQKLGPDGWQTEAPADWPVADYVQELPQRVSLSLEGRTVAVRAWKYTIEGVAGFTVPVFLLDTDLPDNAAADRTLTHYLYGGDARYRLCQEAVLGIGGVRMLRALGYGYADVGRFHMNEGHAALLGLELLEEEEARAGRKAVSHEDVEAVRARCVFTTHTPVPAGHDQFPMDLVERVIGQRSFDVDWRAVVCSGGRFNLTHMALSLSHYVNGVAKRHGEVSRLMFARYTIDSITNGVHAATWASPAFQALFDRHIPDWRKDNLSLRYALSIPRSEVWQAHCKAKDELLQYVNDRTDRRMDPGVLTLGFARRATAYKRADLVFQDPDRLRGIAAQAGPLQIVFAGKAHPNDAEGKELIKRVFAAREALRECVRVAYLEDYDMRLGRLLTAGVDVWLNTPQPPMEASGTSGMKAAVNGVPSLSILDGWWIEGCIEGVTGWAIGSDGHALHDLPHEPSDRSRDAALLYDKLEAAVIPLFYYDRGRFIDVMAHCISLNGSFFNTHRMMQQYVLNAYYR